MKTKAFSKASITILSLIVATLFGCVGTSGLQRDKYFGRFVVLSHFAESIVVIDWIGFGNARPPENIVRPETRCSNSFGWMARLPDRTNVRWKVEGASDELEQELDVAGVVPLGTEGDTVFELSKDGRWSVQFVPRKVRYKQLVFQSCS